MSSLSEYINVEELREILRVFAHRLLIGYEDTQKEEFWLISEKIAEVYEYLYTFVLSQQSKSKKTKFPEDFWYICQKSKLLTKE